MEIENNILVKFTNSDLRGVVNPSDGSIENVAVIPEGVTEIQSYAFNECTDVNNIILPSTLTKINDTAFQFLEHLREISIPDSVTELGRDVFYSCTSLEQVKLPKNLKVLPKGTFEECNELKDIELPEGLEVIGKDAFFACRGIRNIKFPESLKSIKESAFHNCDGLKSVEIPDSVKEIEKSAFEHCLNLRRVKLPKELNILNESVFQSCSWLESVQMPESMFLIEDKAFAYCYGLKSVEIPKTVTRIGDSAFVNCNNLYEVKFDKESFISFGKETFSGCSRLYNVSLPENMTVVGSGMFKNCFSLKSLEIPNTVTTVLERAFQNSGIEDITLPDGITKIYKNTFEGCQSLEYIEIPDSVNHIENFAFQNCKNLKEIKFPKNLKSIGESAFISTALENIEFPEGTLSLGSNAFNYCNKLKSVYIPDSVRKIESLCFTDCENLETVRLPENMVYLENQVFCGCKSLSRINLPKDLEVIYGYAFYNCESLKEVIFPPKLKTIAKGAFERSGLRGINLPDSIENIIEEAFASCYALEKVKLPNNLAEIQTKTFNDCISLKSIEIPSSVKIIKDAAFDGCSALEKVELKEGLEEIYTNAFLDCTALKEIKIPSTVTKVFKNAFDGCNSLKSVHIPENVELCSKTLGKHLKYFKKDDKGFSLIDTPEGDSLPLEDIQLDLVFLSNNWEHKNVLVREQQDYHIRCFYNTCLKRLEKEDIKEFLNNHNFKFFKKFEFPDSNLTSNNIHCYELLYNLGALKKPIEVNGKMIDYSQKVSEFLLQRISRNRLSLEDLVPIAERMKLKGFNREFTEFFLKNFDELMEVESEHEGFIARCYNEFDDVQKTNTSHRGSQRQLKPTVKKFLEYFRENKYQGITEETKFIADKIAPYYAEQEAFNYAVKVYNERKEHNSPNSILGYHLKESNNPFSEIDEYATDIQDIQTEILHNLTNVADEEFTYDWLEKNDPDNYILGKLCSCCAHLDGVGNGIMRASMVHPNVQNLVIRNKKGEIIAKSTLYVSAKNGYGVFNNVEVNDYVKEEDLNAIYEKYILGVREFVKRYNMIHKDIPIKKINVGMNLNDLEEQIKLNHREETDLLKPINYGKYCEYDLGYEGDSSDWQNILYEEGEDYQGPEK